jgi:hypothetical protein
VLVRAKLHAGEREEKLAAGQSSGMAAAVACSGSVRERSVPRSRVCRAGVAPVVRARAGNTEGQRPVEPSRGNQRDRAEASGAASGSEQRRFGLASWAGEQGNDGPVRAAAS